MITRLLSKEYFRKQKTGKNSTNVFLTFSMGLLEYQVGNEYLKSKRKPIKTESMILLV